jgi:hypothetical protein
MGVIDAWWPVALGILGVVMAPIFAFFAARRTSSGRIATSDATDLWQESQKQRDFLNEQVNSLREEIAQAKEESRAEISRLEALVMEKEIEIVRLSTIIQERDIRICRLERWLESRTV